METERNNGKSNGAASSGKKKSGGGAKKSTSGGGKARAASASSSAAATRDKASDLRDGASESRGWTSRLGALASQAGETVRHLPEKASDMQHGIGERLGGVVERASSIQALMFRTFPTLAGQRIEDRETIEAGLSRLRLLAKLLDDLIEIPVLNKKIGLDPVLGMIPGAGMVVPPMISMYTLIEAGHIGAPPEILLKMLGRHVIDYVGSRIPVVGPIFDALYKAHRLNVQDLIAYFEDQLEDLGDADLASA